MQLSAVRRCWSHHRVYRHVDDSTSDFEAAKSNHICNDVRELHANRKMKINIRFLSECDVILFIRAASVQEVQLAHRDDKLGGR